MTITHHHTGDESSRRRKEYKPVCKFDPSRPVKTRDGRPARVLATDVANDKYPLIALVTMGKGIEEPQSFTSQGRYVSDGTETATDLVNVDETDTSATYVNLGQSYSSKHAAQSQYPDWPVLKLTVRHGTADGLEDLREIVSAEIA